MGCSWNCICGAPNNPDVLVAFIVVANWGKEAESVVVLLGGGVNTKFNLGFLFFDGLESSVSEDVNVAFSDVGGAVIVICCGCCN